MYLASYGFGRLAVSELLVSSGATRRLQIQRLVWVVPDLLGSGCGTIPNCVLTLAVTEVAISVTSVPVEQFNI